MTFKLNKFFLLYMLSMTACKLFIYVNYVSIPLMVIFSVVGVVYYLKGEFKYSLSLLLFFSQYENGINLATLGTLPIKGYVIYIGLLFIMFLFRKKFFITRMEFFSTIFVFFFMFLSIAMNIADFNYRSFIVDAFMLIVTLIIIYIYRDISISEIRDVLIYICISYAIYLIALSNFKFGLVPDTYFPDFYFGNRDEIFALILPSSLMLVFLPVKKIVVKMFFLAIFSLNFYLPLFTFGIGSQIIILLPVVLFLLFSYGRWGRLLIVIGLLSFSFVFNFNFSASNNKESLLSHKMNNIIYSMGVLSNNFDVYDIPRSPQVRFIEILNIKERGFFENLFGSGMGSYFTDNYVQFGANINQDDFSQEEIKSRKFYTPHNIGYVFLKYGVFPYLVSFFVLLFLFVKKISRRNLIYLLPMISFVMFNFGWTFKVSIVLSLFLIYILKVNDELSRHTTEVRTAGVK